MTQTEYLALKKTLVQGGMFERMAFIQMMPIGQLAEFIDWLELFSSDRLAENTWRFLAKILAIRAADYVARVDGCPDRFNPDCECKTCELETVDVLAVQRRQDAEVEA